MSKLFEKLYDVPINVTKKKVKNGTRTMHRIDFGGVEKRPGKPGQNVYETCMGIFVNENSIMISNYKLIYFKPMKGKKPKYECCTNRLKQQEAEYEHANKDQPMLSTIKYGEVRLVFSVTKKNKIFRVFHFKNLRKTHRSKTKNKKVSKTKVKEVMVYTGKRALPIPTYAIRNLLRALAESKYQFYLGDKLEKQCLSVNIAKNQVFDILRLELEKKGWLKYIDASRLEKQPIRSFKDV